MTKTTYAVVGTTDEVDACECCGRQNLKMTVMLVAAGSESVVYFGTECAAKAMRLTAKDVKGLIVTARDEAGRRRAAAQKEAQDAYFGWLKERYGVAQPSDLFAVGISPMDALKAYRATH